MRLRAVFLRCLFACAAAPGAALASEPPRRPNIVFILADDLGQRDLAVYGSTFHETPHLDRLAARGVRFTDAYSASPVCSPTRASILTGQYPARLGITDWLPGRKSAPTDRLVAPPLPSHLAASDATLAEVFRSAGYRTAAVGKWHLGDSPAHFPLEHGFDLNIAGSGKGHPPSYFSPYKLLNLTDGPAGEHLDERLTREAISFMRAAAGEAQPFLLYFAHYAVHTPLQARPEAVARYRAKPAGAPLPTDYTSGPPDGRVRQRQSDPTYAAMVESLDASVGALVAALEELGIADNTIVVFTSDNGGLSTAEGSPTSNAPLRTGKGWAYEGGVRVPLLVAWPSRVPAGVSETIVTSPDFFPTLLELAGLPRPAETPPDGQSFVRALQRPEQASPARSIFWHYPHYSNQRGRPHSAIRSGAWKLIEWLEDGRVELYHLGQDLSETRDLAAAEPDRAAALRRELHAWREHVGARMPTPQTEPAR